MDEEMYNVLIFGAGEAYKNRKYYFEWNKDVLVKGYVDNNSNIQGKTINGKMVFAPEELDKLEYDAIVLLSNQYHDSQKQQLIGMGISEDKIWDYYRLKREFAEKENVTDVVCFKDSIAIIAFRFGIDGGSLAALYLAVSLKDEGESVYIITDNITNEARNLVESYGIKIIIYRSLPYMSDSFINDIKACKYVIVNTLQMMPSAIILKNAGVPVCLWVHEGEEIWYKAVSRSVKGSDIPKDMPIAFVSSVSKALFQKYYSDREEIIIPIALPDRMESIVRENSGNYRVAVIGANTVNKNPMLIIRAIKELPKKYRDEIQIDFYGIDEVGKKRIEELADGYVQVHVSGIVTPKEVHKNLDDTDVVVCTSLQECLPTTAIEGFMHRCVVVVPDSAGIADYLTDREDGYIYAVNDEMSLANCIKEIIECKGNDQDLRDRSRVLYEKYFQYSSIKNAFMGIMKKFYCID
ncbi:MAG: glycosyltransferase family 4 protein [Lachnospiraceae bacterium]|nr:glycosyltransferase family 4 protein [Lachnospiraceae bacterium]